MAKGKAKAAAKPKAAQKPKKEKPPLEPQNPLAEVFGFPITNKSELALQHQRDKLCPFGNVVPKCTKVSKKEPLGICSLYYKNLPTIVCPVRFNQDSLIISDAVQFFFPKAEWWMPLPQVTLKDAQDKSAGRIDFVIVKYDEKGIVTDFGALEIQAVYISGNVRRPFAEYMKNITIAEFDWSGAEEYPRPDYLSSSRKRLAPQLIYKGGIFQTWGKKTAVAIDRMFYEELPELEEVKPEEAEMAWFVYDLLHDPGTNTYRLTKEKTLYTKFYSALRSITTTEAGPIERFKKVLEDKLKKALNGEVVADTLLASEALE